MISNNIPVNRLVCDFIPDAAGSCQTPFGFVYSASYGTEMRVRNKIQIWDQKNRYKRKCKMAIKILLSKRFLLQL